MTGLIERIVCMDSAAALAVIGRDPAQARVHDEVIGSTPLHFAAHRGLADVVDALLKAGADVHARERVSDTTPLHWAAEGGHDRVVRSLVAAGAQLDVVDAWFSLPPLAWATMIVDWAPRFRSDKPRAAKQLIELGATIDVFSAVGLGMVDVLRALASTRGDLLRQRLGFAGEERTPMHVAAALGKVDVVQTLLEVAVEGATETTPPASELVNAITAFGERPLGIARDDASELLRKHGAVDERALLARGRRVAGAIEKTLRDKLAFATARDGRIDEAYVLIDLGADLKRKQRILVNEVPADGTAADLAKANGHDDVADLFRNASR